MAIEKRILIVDDEETILEVMSDAVRSQGYSVETASGPELALSYCEKINFDMAIVDMRMPGKMDGLALLCEVRKRWPTMIVIMLTAYASIDTAIAALRQGAYDYLVKPVGISQILASIERGLMKSEKEAHMRRMINELESVLEALKLEYGIIPMNGHEVQRFIQTPAVTIDRQKRLVVKDGKPVILTATEFDLLDFLASQPERVVTSQELIRAVQGYELSEADARPIIRVHIRRLRQKLEEDPDQPAYILNVRGKGYRFAG